MTTSVSDLLYGVASQTLVFVAPEGRPSSVTSVSIFENRDGDDGTAEVATTGSPAVVTNPNTTLDGAAGPSQSDPNLIPVAATTGLEVGGRYLVTAATGETEWIEAESINSGVSVRARTPLHNDFATSDTLATTAISVSILDSWAADENNISPGYEPNARYRARWVYTVDSVVRVRDSYFDLVRYPGDTGVTAVDIERLLPGWLNALPTHHKRSQGADLIAEAYQQVKVDLHAIGRGDQAARNSEIIDELVKRKTIELWANARVLFGSGTLDQAEQATIAYRMRFDSLVSTDAKIPFDTDSTGAGRRVAAMPLTRR